MATTTITIGWINTQVYPKDLALLIYYNPEEIAPVFEEGETTVPCLFRQTVLVSCEYLADEPGVIKVTNILQVEQNPGMQISLTLTNQQILVTSPQETESWKLATFTDSTTAYAIEKISGGMTITFGCNFPCLTCRDDDPDYCTSCNQYFEDYLILYEGKCTIDCPVRTFKEAY